MNSIIDSLRRIFDKMQRFDVITVLDLFSSGRLSEEEAVESLLGIETQLSGQSDDEKKIPYIEIGPYLCYLRDLRTLEKIEQYSEVHEEIVYGLLLNRNAGPPSATQMQIVWYAQRALRDAAYDEVLTWMIATSNNKVAIIKTQPQALIGNVNKDIAI